MNRAILKSFLLFMALISSYQIAFATGRDSAECGARAMIIEYSINAYYGQYSDSKFRSQKVAVDYVSEKMAGQNLKKKESQVLIARTVKYTYEVLQPQDFSPNFIPDIQSSFYKNCLFDPEGSINNFYIVDWKKANSINTDGQIHYQNKDESITVCSKGKCETKYPPPQTGAYEDVRKKVIKLGWNPAPETLKPILIKSQRIDSQGFKHNTNVAYGNCLTDHSLCDETKPELADCNEENVCTAVWDKDGETIYYLVQAGKVIQYNHVPKNSRNR